MKINKKYQGVIVPVITPLAQDHSLDHEGIEKIFSYLYANDAQPFILGTTGESASLRNSVKLEYIQHAVELKKPGTILYAGVSSNCLEESVEFANRCFDAGIDAVAATLPSYYHLSETQMMKYFEKMAEDVNGPLIIYNIPATTQMSIPLHLIDELSYHENIVATKDSERNETRLNEALTLWSKREDFSHFMGWAGKSAYALINGSDGLIPSTGNLHPALYSEMVKAVLSGDEQKAYSCQLHSDLLGNLYQSGRSLGESLWGLKVLMSEYGLCLSNVMPPLQNLSKEEELVLKQNLQQLLNKEGIQINISLSHV